MSLVAAMIEYLKDQAAVAAVFGDRIYNTFAPASAQKPYATLQDISGTTERHMTGQSDLSFSRVQANAVVDTARDARLGAKALYGELGGYPGGTMGSGDVATHVRSITRVGRGALPREAVDGSEEHGYDRRQDFGVWYRETAPTFT